MEKGKVRTPTEEAAIIKEATEATTLKRVTIDDNPLIGRKEIPLPAEVFKDAEKIGKSLNLSPDEVVQKIIEEKAKPEKEKLKTTADVTKRQERRAKKREAKGLTFPIQTKVNKYGFLRFSADLLSELLGKPWKMKQADISVSIERVEGGVIVRLKA